MIEPIGETPLSPYDRYSQYQQYKAAGSLWDAAPPGRAASNRQALPPGQAVQPGQGAQAPGSLRMDAPRKPGAAGNARAAGDRECQTCKNRRYQDQSDDPGVSYQSPTKISPDRAASAVRSHENEHVSREQAKAKREGREVVSQSVVIKTAICPECGKVYISGGTTTTVTRPKGEDSLFRAGQPKEAEGRFIDKNI